MMPMRPVVIKLLARHVKINRRSVNRIYASKRNSAIVLAKKLFTVPTLVAGDIMIHYKLLPLQKVSKSVRSRPCCASRKASID